MTVLFPFGNMKTTPATPPAPPGPASVGSPAELGLLVRQHRKAQGLTQQALAAACGTGVRFIVDLEAGKSTCQLGRALRVTRMLGLTVLVESKGARRG